MPDAAENRSRRLEELIWLLGRKSSRHGVHPGEERGLPWGVWAAKLLALEFGVQAVMPIAEAVLKWQRLPADHRWLHERHQDAIAYDREILAVLQQGDRLLGRSARPPNDPQYDPVYYRNNVASDAGIALGEISGADKVLLDGLKNSDPSARACAAAGLGALNRRNPVYVDPLIDALGDHNALVVDTASWALTRITEHSFWFGTKDAGKWRRWWATWWETFQRETKRKEAQKEAKRAETMKHTDCPRGHGPLRPWNGNPRCWTCGWPEK